jgi:arylsulfatase A-like enzyme
VLNVDIAPTILALAGCPAPSVMQGADFSPLVRGERPAAWRADFFYEHPQGGDADFIPASEALVTKDLKYILWPGRQYEELFDLRKDPLEEHNVVKEPAYLADLERLRRRFARLKRDAG